MLPIADILLILAYFLNSYLSTPLIATYFLLQSKKFLFRLCYYYGMAQKLISKKFLLNLATAYLDARRHKRWKNNTLQFSGKSEQQLLKLAEDIQKRTYKIKPSLCFIAFKPVQREIFAGDFRDRIIHHLVFNILNPYYDKLFINDCYSCRLKRGTDYGIKRINYFIKAASKNYTQPAYILKLDISGYFMTIDRQLLYRKNKELIKKFLSQEPEKINTLLYLLKLIIFNNPIKDCRRRGQVSDWNGLPKNKSLFGAPVGRGLPIGNLTSQIFGNVYLNDFDHFIKEKLKCHYYGRYVDDMVFVDNDKEFLKSLIPLINNYLKTKLGLSLHPKKIYLQPYRNGLKFLGTVIKPHRLYIGSRIKGNFYKKLKTNNQTSPAFLNSYLGLMKKYQTYNLRRKMINNPLAQTTLKKLKMKVTDNYDLAVPEPIDLFKKLNPN